MWKWGERILGLSVAVKQTTSKLSGFKQQQQYYLLFLMILWVDQVVLEWPNNLKWSHS